MSVGVVKSFSQAIGTELYEEISKLGNLYLIGGSLRDYKLNKSFEASRDIDVVVDVADNSDWEVFIHKHGGRKNRFGGYKIHTQSTSIDIWPLEKTWAYENKKIKCRKKKNVYNLNDTVFLNIDAISYDVTHKCFHDYKYKKAIESNTLDIVLEDNPEIDLNIARSIVMKKKYNLSYSTHLKEFIFSHALCNDEYINELYNIITKRYGKKIMRENEVREEIKKIFYEESHV